MRAGLFYFRHSSHNKVVDPEFNTVLGLMFRVDQL